MAEIDFSGMTPEQAWQAMQQQQQQAAPAAAPPVDYTGMTPEQAWELHQRQQQQALPPSSSGVGAMTRAALEEAPAIVGGLPGALAGATLAGGATLGNPVAALIGAIVGAGASAATVNAAKEWAMQHFGLREGTGFFSEAQRQADTEQHPYWQLAGGGLDTAAAFGTGVGEARLIQRALTGGIAATQEGIAEGQRGDLSAGRIATAGMIGAAFPSFRAWSGRVANVGAEAAAKLGPKFAEEAAKMRFNKPPPTPPNNQGGLGTTPPATKPMEQEPANVGSGGSGSETKYPKAPTEAVPSPVDAGFQDDVNTPMDKDIIGQTNPRWQGVGGAVTERLDTGLAAVAKSQLTGEPVAKPNAELEGVLSTTPEQDALIAEIQKTNTEKAKLTRAKKGQKQVAPQPPEAAPAAEENAKRAELEAQLEATRAEHDQLRATHPNEDIRRQQAEDWLTRLRREKEILRNEGYDDDTLSHMPYPKLHQEAIDALKRLGQQPPEAAPAPAPEAAPAPAPEAAPATPENYSLNAQGEMVPPGGGAWKSLGAKKAAMAEGLGNALKRFAAEQKSKGMFLTPEAAPATPEEQANQHALDWLAQKRAAEGQPAPAPQKSLRQRMDEREAQYKAEYAAIPNKPSAEDMRNAGFTDHEIRNPHHIDPAKIRKVNEGYVYHAGEFKQMTPELLQQAAEGVTKAKARRIKELKQIDEKIKEAGPGNVPDLQRVFGSDWHPGPGYNGVEGYIRGGRDWANQQVANAEAHLARYKAQYDKVKAAEAPKAVEPIGPEARVPPEQQHTVEDLPTWPVINRMNKTQLERLAHEIGLGESSIYNIGGGVKKRDSLLLAIKARVKEMKEPRRQKTEAVLNSVLAEKKEPVPPATKLNKKSSAAKGSTPSLEYAFHSEKEPRQKLWFGDMIERIAKGDIEPGSEIAKDIQKYYPEDYARLVENYKAKQSEAKPKALAEKHAHEMTPEEMQAEIDRLNAEKAKLKPQEKQVIPEAIKQLEGKNDKLSQRRLAALKSESTPLAERNTLAASILHEIAHPNRKPGTLVKTIRKPFKAIKAKNGMTVKTLEAKARVDRSIDAMEAGLKHKLEEPTTEYPSTPEAKTAFKTRILEALIKGKEANQGKETKPGQHPTESYPMIPRSAEWKLYRAMEQVHDAGFTPQAMKAYVAKELDLKGKLFKNERVAGDVEGSIARNKNIKELTERTPTASVEQKAGVEDMNFEPFDNPRDEHGVPEEPVRFENESNNLRNFMTALPDEVKAYILEKEPDAVLEVKSANEPVKLQEHYQKMVEDYYNEQIAKMEAESKDLGQAAQEAAKNRPAEQFTLSRITPMKPKAAPKPKPEQTSLKNMDPAKFAALKAQIEAKTNADLKPRIDAADKAITEATAKATEVAKVIPDKPTPAPKNEPVPDIPDKATLEKSADAAVETIDAAETKPTWAQKIIQSAANMKNDTEASLNLGAVWSDIKKIMPEMGNLLPNVRLPKGFKEFVSRPTSGRQSARYLATAVEKSAAVVSDVLHAMDMRDIRDAYRVLKLAWITPKEFKNKIVQEKIYNAHERNQLHKLTPREREYYDKWLLPFLKENQALYEELRKFMPWLKEESSLWHVHRIRQKAFAPKEINANQPIAGQDTSQLRQMQALGQDIERPEILEKRQLNKVTPSTMDRTFKALENQETGARMIISKASDTDAHDFTSYHHGTAVNHRESGFDFENGTKFKMWGREYKVVDAYTSDIEKNVKDEFGNFMKYHKSLAESTYAANAELRRALRHVYFLEGLKGARGAKQGTPEYGNPEFRANATTDANKAAKMGWKESINPQFKGWYMADAYRYVLDDYARPGFAGESEAWKSFQNMSRRITKLLFWLPTPHVLNVGWHWYVARGGKWFTPSGYRSLQETAIKAIQSVVSQDAIQTEILDNGGSLFHKATEIEMLGNKMAQEFGQEIMQNPRDWQPVVDALGLKGTADLVSQIYHGSRRSMWFANDVMYTQLYMEARAKGLDPKAAIIKVEKHFPNYRVGGTVMGSRALSQFMQDPGTNAFGRYRVGVFTSYAHIIKDIVHGTPEERAEAGGNLLAMGVVGFLIKPVLDKIVQYLTGNEMAEVAARGPIAIPTHAVRAAMGQEDISTLFGATLTIPPLAKTVLELYNNQDWAGKKVVQPGSGPIDASVQIGSHLATGLIAPLGTASNILEKKENIAHGIADALLDIKEPSTRARLYKRKQDITNRKALRLRHRPGKAPTMIEDIYNRLFN